MYNDPETIAHDNKPTTTPLKYSKYRVGDICARIFLIVLAVSFVDAVMFNFVRLDTRAVFAADCSFFAGALFGWFFLKD